MASATHSPTSKEPRRPPKRIPVNPIETALKAWFQLLPNELLATISLTLDSLLANAPKRWVVYVPMVLLPSGSFGHEWQRLSKSVIPELQNELWILILSEIGKREGKGVLSRLAINSGIPLNKSSLPEQDILNPDVQETSENILRSPSGLIMLYGDFGPSLSPEISPTEQDFLDAFWVSTKQNGITQVWAPRYTMFSRGNIKEKARLINFHKPGGLESRKISKHDLENAIAVDLYAGIGYFVFSYVAMGMGRVVGCELNPWSVEGLRRGAAANGWTIKVIKPDEELEVDGERIIIFIEDNRKVEDRLASVGWKRLQEMQILHVNCGLLPTSNLVWKPAYQILGGDGWLHLHENVGVDDIQQRKCDIEATFNSWNSSKGTTTARIEHVELVKMFAPGVWHCVFDVHVTTDRIL